MSGGKGSEAQSFLAFVKKTLPDVLSAKFNTLRPALLEAHGVADGPASGGGYSPAPPDQVAQKKKEAPKPAPAAASTSSAAALSTPVVSEAKKEEKKLSGTKVVQVEAELRASADDLWSILTDEGKIPMWSRSAAQVGVVVSTGHG